MMDQPGRDNASGSLFYCFDCAIERLLELSGEDLPDVSENRALKEELSRIIQARCRTLAAPLTSEAVKAEAEKLREEIRGLRQQKDALQQIHEREEKHWRNKQEGFRVNGEILKSSMADYIKLEEKAKQLREKKEKAEMILQMKRIEKIRLIERICYIRGDSGGSIPRSPLFKYLHDDDIRSKSTFEVVSSFMMVARTVMLLSICLNFNSLPCMIRISENNRFASIDNDKFVSGTDEDIIEVNNELILSRNAEKYSQALKRLGKDVKALCLFVDVPAYELGSSTLGNLHLLFKKLLGDNDNAAEIASEDGNESTASISNRPLSVRDTNDVNNRISKSVCFCFIIVIV